jgi:diamine N-acetyltransferase
MKNNDVAITYTQGGPECLDSITPLWMKLREHHLERSPYFKEQIKKMNWDIRKPYLLEKSANGALLVQMAQDKKTLVGYCVSSISSKNEGEIESIYIEKDYRKQNIGDRFMKTALVWMDVRGVTVKIIGVAVGNEEAFGFYQKYNFYPRVTVLRQLDTK